MISVRSLHHIPVCAGNRRLQYTSYTKMILVAVSLIPVSSCKTVDTDKDGLPDNKDKCPTEYAKTATGCAPAEKIDAVRFFIDRSGSMDGYYRGKTAFVKDIGDLLVKVESIRPITEIWQVADSAEQFKGSTGSFRNQMAQTQIKGGKSSMMNNIFEEIAEKTGSNDISLFVSDGILSFPDREIKKNSNINSEKASALKDDIFTTFSKLRSRKHYGISVYAFRSSFTGKYYNYRNEKKTLSGEERPYYVWITGKKNLLKQFNTELTGFSTFQPEEQAHFGLHETTDSTVRFIPSFERSGSWELNDDGTGIKHIGNKAARFSIAINLSGLPAYIQSAAYLREHISFGANGCKASLIQVRSKEEIDPAKIRGDRQKETLQQATHVLTIEIQRMNTRNATLKILLPAAPDTWYMDWSCDDDLDQKKTCNGKTFAFKYLMEGIIQAYQGNDNYFINLPVSLKQ